MQGLLEGLLGGMRLPVSSMSSHRLWQLLAVLAAVLQSAREDEVHKFIEFDQPTPITVHVFEEDAHLVVPHARLPFLQQPLQLVESQPSVVIGVEVTESLLELGLGIKHRRVGFINQRGRLP